MMGPRVTPPEVETLMQRSLPTALLLLQIEAASTVVDTLAGSGLSPTQLRFCELHLAAHYSLIGAMASGVSSERIGDAEVQYATADAGHSSVYWDTANALAGGLLAGTTMKRAVFQVVTPRCY
jgi:hypothetical protein